MTFKVSFGVDEDGEEEWGRSCCFDAWVVYKIMFWYYFTQMILKVPINAYILFNEERIKDETPYTTEEYDPPHAMVIQSLVGMFLLMIKICSLRNDIENHDAGHKVAKGNLFNIFFITTAIDTGALLTCIVNDMVLLKEQGEVINEKWAYWYFGRVAIDIIFSVFLYLHSTWDNIGEAPKRDHEPPYDVTELENLLHNEELNVYGPNYGIQT